MGLGIVFFFQKPLVRKKVKIGYCYKESSTKYNMFICLDPYKNKRTKKILGDNPKT